MKNRRDKVKNKLIKIAPDTFVLIPRFECFKNRNLATKIEKDKRKKSRRKEKQDLLKNLRKEGWI